MSARRLGKADLRYRLLIESFDGLIFARIVGSYQLLAIRSMHAKEST